MFSIKFILVLTACLIAYTAAAPAAESVTEQAPNHPTSVTNSASAPSTDNNKHQNTTTSMSEADHHLFMNTTFTCYGRALGYYADVDQGCRVYHFCLQGDYNGEPVYQRISYLCLGDTVFDQQQLDCVAPSSIKASCKESTTHYVISNSILRQSILGQRRDATTEAAQV